MLARSGRVSLRSYVPNRAGHDARSADRQPTGARCDADGRQDAPARRRGILDCYLAAGGNFIDTADVYENGGSERVLAPWLARHRSEVVVATKVRFEVSDPGGAGLAPDRIRAECDASLRGSAST